MGAPLRYASVCSGIEGATLAWQRLGWKSVFVSEIEPFPCALLKHHYPDVPNYGDMTRFREWPDADFDVLVGGTPCQSFSVAGLRAGLADPRGNLALVFLAILDRYRPKWVVWENVPGVLSSDSHDAPDPCPPPPPLDVECDGQEVDTDDEYDAIESRALGCFLAGLSELGYGFAYRVLDAQHFGVPQRRRRVFVVGHLGDWRRAAAVLFERHSLSGDSPPRREAGERIAARPRCGASVSSGIGWWDESSVAATVRAQDSANKADTLIHAPEISCAIKARDYKGPSSDGDGDGAPLLAVARTLRGEGFDAMEDGTGRGTPLVPVVVGTLVSNGDAHSGYRDERGLVPVAFSFQQGGDHTTSMNPSPVAPTLSRTQIPATAYQCQGSNVGEMGTLRAGNGNETGGVPFVFANTAGDTNLGMSREGVPPLTRRNGDPGNVVIPGMAVRRITPLEAERLQGVPDGYTAVPYNGKPAADGPRYKALGNGFAIPVVTWIGERIQMVEDLCP